MPRIERASGTAYASRGSRGIAHNLTQEAIKKRQKTQSLIDYDAISTLLARLISKIYGCDPKCLKVQLDKYYKSKYGCAGKPKVVAHTGKTHGGPKTDEDKGAKD